MASKKPFFSRRQLNIIIVVTAAVIALLSLQSDPWPDVQRTFLHQTTLTSLTQQEATSEIRLMFALPEQRAHPQQSAQILAELLRHRLQQNAASAWQLQLQRDRLTLTLQTEPHEQLGIALGSIGQQLSQPFSPDNIQLALKQARAQQHLNRNKPQPASALIDRRLNPQEQQPAEEADISALQQQLFSRTHLRIALISSEPELIKPLLETMLTQLAPSSNWPTTADIETTPYDSKAQSPIALQQLAARPATDFPQTLLYSRIFSDLAQPTHVTLYPGVNSSWRVWQQAQGQPANTQWLAQTAERIKQRLSQMKDWELRNSADELREQLMQRLEQPTARADLLALIAFYQLPVDYLPTFDATIAALTGTEIRQQLLRQLEPEQFSHIDSRSLADR